MRCIIAILTEYWNYYFVGQNGEISIPAEKVKEVIDTEPHASVNQLKLYLRHFYNLPTTTRLILFIRRENQETELTGGTLESYGITGDDCESVYARLILP